MQLHDAPLTEASWDHAICIADHEGQLLVEFTTIPGDPKDDDVVYVKTRVLNLPTTSTTPTIKIEQSDEIDVAPSSIVEMCGLAEEEEEEEDDNEDKDYMEDEEDEGDKEDEEEDYGKDEVDAELEHLSPHGRGDAGDGGSGERVSTVDASAGTSSRESRPAQEKLGFEEDDREVEEIDMDFNKIPVTEQDELAADAEKEAEKEVQNSTDNDWYVSQRQTRCQTWPCQTRCRGH